MIPKTIYVIWFAWRINNISWTCDAHVCGGKGGGKGGDKNGCDNVKGSDYRSDNVSGMVV